MITKLKPFIARACRACSRVPLWACALAIFAVALVARLYWIGEKQGMHIDESFSLQLAFYNPKNPWQDDAKKHGGVSKIFTGAELKKLEFACDPSVPAALDTVKKLRKDNRDSPHTNFYYSLLRLWWTDDGKTSLSSLVWRGCTLNLVFFAGTFWAMFALLKKLFGAGNRSVICVGLAAGTLCSGAISNTLFMRPYALQEPFFVLFTLGFVALLERLRGNAPIISPKNLFLGIALTALTLLTAYFAVIYVILLFAVLIFFAFRGNEKRSVPFLCVIFAGAVGLAMIIYPGYIDGFFDYRGAEAAGKFALNTLGKNLGDSLHAVASSLCDALYYTPLLALLVVFGVWRYFFERPREDAPTAAGTRVPAWLAPLLVAVALAWSCACMFLAPYKTMRYIMALFPILSLLVPWLAAQLSGVKRAVFAAGTLAICVACAFFAKGGGDPLGRQKNVLKSPIAQVEQVFPGRREEIDKQLPRSQPPMVVVASSNRSWTFTNLLPYLRNADRFIFVFDTKKLPETVSRERPQFILKERNLKDMSIPKSVRTSVAFDCFAGYFDIVHVEYPQDVK